MAKKNPCPVCEGVLKQRKTHYYFGNLDLGEYDADVCESCGEKFFTEEASDLIDAKAKELGVWGLSKETKIGYSGNALIIRIPKKIADFMDLHKGEGVLVYPEGTRKLVAELES